jgi:cell division protein FtsN
MPSHHNLRRTITITYDPKQRFIGGIVLFLIMLLIYSTLKIVLGFSGAPKEFKISAPLEIEKIAAQEGSETAMPRKTSSRDSRNPVRLPSGFVFLDLDGNPMQPEVYQEESLVDPFEIVGEKKWYVQAASFRDRDKAEEFAQQIKNNNIASQVYVTLKGKWYAVRLSPENERRIAQQQVRQLRRLGTKAIIKKLN